MDNLQPNFDDVRNWFREQGFVGKTYHNRERKIKHITDVYRTKLDRQWMKPLYVGDKRIGWYARWYAGSSHWGRSSQIVTMKCGKRYGSSIYLKSGSLSVAAFTGYLPDSKDIRLCREDLSISNDWHNHNMMIMLKLPIDKNVLIRFLDFMRSNEFEIWYTETYAVGKTDKDIEKSVETKLFELGKE